MGEIEASVAVHEGLFTREGGKIQLIGGKCTRCGEHHFPRSTTCPYCSAGETVEVLLSDTGRLWAWTAVHAPPPGYEGDIPFGFGVVELPEGVRVITRLTQAAPQKLAFRQQMKTVVAPLHVDEQNRQVITYAFSPVEDAR